MPNVVSPTSPWNPGKRRWRTVRRGATVSSVEHPASTKNNLIFCDGFLIDTGSRVTIVPKKFSRIHRIPGSRGPLIAANGSIIRTYGIGIITPHLLGKSYSHPAVVADVIHPILGQDFFNTTGSDLLIDPARKVLFRRKSNDAAEINSIESPTVNDADAEKEALKILNSFPKLARTSLGKVSANMQPLRIDTGNASPVFSKARPLFGEKKIQVEAEIRKWEEEGVIVRVDEEVNWASPLHAVRKKDGTWRVCGDFRRLNAVTKSDKFPLPSVTEFNANMAGCRIFSKLDLRRAYHQVPVAEQDQEKTTINSTLGLFKFVRSPFGVKNAGNNFQRNIIRILRRFKFVFVYLDDVIIGSHRVVLVFGVTNLGPLSSNIGFCP